MGNVALDLGTYRTAGGELVHCWSDGSGVLTAEREGPNGPVRIDPSVLTGVIKLSDDPFWPEEQDPAREPVWRE
ncbi:MAG TPA: hypothetical protein VM690_05775 [Gaiellaceae bacterium]|nr:hypothetical protein [Gaiellaceae bacterium]